MIRQVRGIVSGIGEQSVVIDVGGIGYLVYTSAAPSNFTMGQEALLYTYLAVRETALDLYGFPTLDELEIFELLITLPKIGPKSALQILSQADIMLLKEAVANDDPSYLSKMSGIGKKSAEKIVAGLKEKFDADELFAAPQSGAAFSASGGSNLASDTIDALIALGYPQHDARKVVHHISVEYSDLTDTNEAVRLALKLLSN